MNLARKVSGSFVDDELGAELPLASGARAAAAASSLLIDAATAGAGAVAVPHAGDAYGGDAVGAPPVPGYSLFALSLEVVLPISGCVGTAPPLHAAQLLVGLMFCGAGRQSLPEPALPLAVQSFQLLRSMSNSPVLANA